MLNFKRRLGLMALCLASTTAWADLAETTNAMAPLELRNSSEWSAFEWQLEEAAGYGLDGVSVDVWWGMVEGDGDGQYDWSYYDAIFDTIISRGLQIIPIMSFHQCGGNVGDDCGEDVITRDGNSWKLGQSGTNEIPIPWWIWEDIPAQHTGLSAADMRYKSEFGNYSVETVSLWADDYVLDQYADFMAAFQDRYEHLADHIIELNISMGPAGELRYPSYNQHDDGHPVASYPGRGALQAYGRLAIEDFQGWAEDKYGNLTSLNNAWGTSLSSFEQVNPPSDAQFFFDQEDHLYNQYGRDFIRWYHESLTAHGTRMLNAAMDGFDGAFSDIELGMKIPGIHWQIGNPSDSMRRVPEMAAGLIPSDIDIYSPATGHGYESMISTTQTGSDPNRNVVLHFTALEMGNPDSYPGYSRAEDLVFWVGEEGGNQGVDLKGENALAGGAMTHFGWDQIENAFTHSSYNGLTILRLQNVTENNIGRNRYAQFIQNFHAGTGSGGATVSFTCNNGNTYWGQSVYAVGDVPELGNWDPAQGVLLDATNYPTWSGAVSDLPENTGIEWKCVKREESNPSAGVEWQSGSNNQVTTGGAGSSVGSSGSF